MFRAIVVAALNIALPVAALAWGISMNRRSVVFAFAINWALMLFAFIAFLVAPIRFARGYYRVWRFERDGRLYERIGVRAFQTVLRRTKFHGPRPFPRYPYGPGALGQLEDATYGPETAHALIFMVVIGLAMDAARRGWWDTAAWLVLFDVLLNAYPVFSMRYVRARAAMLAAAVTTRRSSQDRSRAAGRSTAES